MGEITEIATSAPGHSSMRPNTKAPLAETLKLNGYSTAQFGKCHEVPVWQTSPMGPFDTWPAGRRRFRVLLRLHRRGEQPVVPGPVRGHDPGRAAEDAGGGLPLDEDMADSRDRLGPAAEGADAGQAVLHLLRTWRRPTRRTTCPRSGPTSTRGKFDQGWDKLREEIFARQKELGVIPADAELTARPAEIPAWDDMPDALKPVLARQMEVYAGFLEHTDYHVGRVVDALEQLGILDDTLIYLHHRRQRRLAPRAR